MGCTEYRDHYDLTGEDLLVEACTAAFEDAGIDGEQIQAAWLGGGITGQTLNHALKLKFIPTSKVENWCATGTDVFRNAATSVAAGLYDIVLVAGFAAKSDVQAHDVGIFNGGPTGEWLFGPEVGFSGAGAASTFATFATRYAHHYELTYDQLKQGLGAIAVKNYYHGSMNPRAYLRKRVTMEEYLGARMISWPLGLHDCSSMPSGAAAAVVVSPRIAKARGLPYMTVRGQGMAVGTKRYRMDSDYDWTHFPENVMAATTAYEQAGITNPLEEIDIACMHDAFTVVELCTYEDLGFAPRGAGGDYAREGVFTLGGTLPVNTNGGLKSFGHGGGSSGIHKMFEVYSQLLGRSGERQVENARVGLVHDQGGYPGTYTSVISVFERED